MTDSPHSNPAPRPPRPRAGIQLEHTLSRLLGGQTIFILVLAAVLGIAGGYGAILFRLLIEGVNHLAFPGGIKLDQLASAPWYRVLLPPALGGLVVGPLVYFLAREAKGHGVPEVMDATLNRGGLIRPRVAAVKILASAVCIGSGGSVGREGPIVQIGSAVGSSLGHFFGLAGERLKTMVAAGAAAGIAATFNAPIAGVLFATEIILGRGSARTFSPLIVSSVIATVVTRIHLGNFPAFQLGQYRLVSPWELPLYVLLGALGALVGVAFTKGLYALEDLWEKMPALPEYTWGVLGGTIIGALGLWLPQLMGVGYEHIEEILRWRSSHIMLGTMQGAGMLLLIVALKIFATGTTIGSGGSGGIFAPSLFMGASLGGAFGTVVQRLMPHTAVADPPAYATVAMGAVVAATTHAPLQAILIVFELTDRHTIILPLMLSCILSAVMAMWLSRDSIYTLKLIRRGSRVGGGVEAEIMTTAQVHHLVQPTGETLHPDTPLTELVELVVEHHHPHIYVVDDDGLLQGVVNVDDVATILRDADTLQPLLLAADVMRHCSGHVRQEDTLDRCLTLFSRRQMEELPVVDHGRLVGVLARADVIRHYNREILRRDAVLKFVEQAEREGPDGERLQLPTGDVKDELAVKGQLVGRTLRELNLRARFGVTIYAMRDAEGDASSPQPDRPLTAGETLVLYGPPEGVSSVRDLSLVEE